MKCPICAHLFINNLHTFFLNYEVSGFSFLPLDTPKLQKSVLTQKVFIWVHDCLVVPGLIQLAQWIEHRSEIGTIVKDLA